MAPEHALFQVGQKGIILRDGHVLVLEAAYREPGFWDIPGGRMHIGEDAETAFRRELLEETGLSDIRILRIADYSLWFQKERPSVCLIGLVAETNSVEIQLSHEHVSHRWITESEIDSIRFVHEGMKGMLHKGFAYYSLLHHGS